MYQQLLLLIAVLIIGCSDDTSRVKIGVSVPETTAPTYTLMRQAMIEEAKAYGIQILWNGVRDKENTQNVVSQERQQIQRLFEAGIRVLIINPVDEKAAYPILREAHRWGVPVLSLDRMLISMPVRGHIAVNEIGLGEEAARYVVKQIGNTGNVLVLEGPIGVKSMRNIAIGVYRILDQYPDAIRVFSRTTGRDTESAFNLTNQVLKNYAGNIQAIIAVDSIIAEGAVRGVQLHGLSELIITVGVGAGKEACRQIILKQHDAEVDLMPYERGLEALKSAIDALDDQLPFAYDDTLPNGEILTKTKFAPIRLITLSNSSELQRMWPDLFVQK